MDRKLIQMAVCLAVFAASAAAQTTVQTSGTTSAGTVPVFGPSSNTTVTNSPISVSGGRVGIGTTSPGSTLDVDGSARIADGLVLGNASTLQFYNATGVNQEVLNLFTDNNLYITDMNSGSIFLRTGGYNIRETIAPNGNVGIGTTSPSYLLDVAGQIHSSGGIVFPDGSIQNTAFSQVASGSNVITEDNGNVGIGTTTPATELDVVGGNVNLYAGYNIGTATIGSNNVTAPLYEFAGVQYMPNGAPAGGFGLFSGANVASPVVWMYNYGGNNAFQVRSVGYNSSPTAGNVLLDVDTSGNVGIGTASPSYALDVNGSVHTSGSIVFSNGSIQTVAYTGTTCGGDYAESMDVTGERTKYTPGDVLVLDTAHPGKILKSIEPYSTAVAGIYSTKPGTVGRRQLTPPSDTEVPMAMVGVVPAKVTAENGAIHVGDLLVSSSQPGYAMKGTDRSRMLGALIGKAMGTLDSGTGTIEVLVTLQ